MEGRARRLAELLPSYARLAWWGLFAPRLGESGPLRIVQAVVRSDRGVLLSVRADLRGWELPGGNLRPGEAEPAALRREVREETGLEVGVERCVGEYVRTGFLPHVARVYACRVQGGRLQPSVETPRVAWFDPAALPRTLFPWYRAPLCDALANLPQPVVRHEHQGVRSVWAGMTIDLRMRWQRDRVG
jgi:8-oxo-dGTP pyrophosphatase MutT (NUDIX family)